jgi:hypothetical protein
LVAGDVVGELICAAIRRHNDIYRVTVREENFHGYLLRVALNAKDYFPSGT